jgi:hypothetical protein
VRPGFGQRRTVDDEDRPIEPVARKDGLQMLRRMARRETNVGIEAQEPVYGREWLRK